MNFTRTITFTGCLIASTTVYAHPPTPNVYDGGNRWTITAYDDASPNHTEWATQGICFLPYTTVGTHIRGVWYSDTFPDWNGRYTQEGDQVFMHGDYAKRVGYKGHDGHDGMAFEIVRSSYANTGGGHWKEWRESGGIENGVDYGRTVGFANAKFKRVGKCPVITKDEIADLNIPTKYLSDGRVANNPFDADQRTVNELIVK